MTTRVIISDLADADVAEILAEIAREACYRAGVKYNFGIERLYDRLAEHPDSCETRGASKWWPLSRIIATPRATTH